MSIAVSAVVKPSMALLVMVGAMCAGVIVIAVALAAGEISELTLPVRLSLAGVGMFLAVFIFYRTKKTRKTFHIDISGSGQIRLAEYIDLAAFFSEGGAPDGKGSAKEVRLMADSILWPNLLLLRLQAENQHVTVVPILSDCVAADSFRALAVACRWLAAHNNGA